tara:strand:- start:201 stop:320 length:120 start_codon:yes stop_codon:yes gene_type:complete
MEILFGATSSIFFVALKVKENKEEVKRKAGEEKRSHDVP